MLTGAIAAAVTPLRPGGERLDEPAIAPLVRFVASRGIDGVLVCGTTGEGILLTVEERRRTAELFLAARPSGFAVAVHCGAQSTRDTVDLAEHAASAGADAVAVIAPPYFALDDEEVLEHLRRAADACAPVPFYVYEFAARSGYAVPVAVVERLREASSNLAGLKVSDSPFDRVRAYLVEGLDVFVGAEPLVLDGLRSGAAGAVSGLANAWPELVSALVRDRSEAAHHAIWHLRHALSGIPFPAAIKTALGARGVDVEPAVRAPLRGLTATERDTATALASRYGSAPP